ncbi:hypothetical protein Pyrfu_1785 [Pyrolobus fumarii 1A]|uniref:Uncharacterized protein n=1 Tax=Pyrolobus fumarii (strain DSM 11204 / 1A) TaxID=694429 RepID=G0ECR9_PYRF1|nr:hypothetical protein [Pyrolobus fumarii]AEM39639.1 hypothetical protein Pyrfu_1785 [Pyrolobus fumarii 1A]
MQRIPIPRLLWKLPLPEGTSLESVVAHSFSMYELVFGRSGEFVAAYGVDMLQGVLWSDEREGGLYITRGLRVENGKIVDTAGSVLLKLRLEPKHRILGRRVVLLVDDKKVKVVDRASLSVHLEGDARYSGFENDAYTLAAVVKTSRRGFTVVVDTIYGFEIVKMSRQPRNVRASRGCATICDNIGCIVSNGVNTVRLVAVNVKPLAASHSTCIVTLRSDSKWIVAMVKHNNIDVLDSCDEEPRVIYSDTDMVIYMCDNSTRTLLFASNSAVITPSASNAILTPSFTLSVKREHGVEILEGNVGDTRIKIPVDTFYAVNRDKLLVVSSGWAYSIDLSEYEDIMLNLGEGKRCPIEAKIGVQSYTLLDLSINHNVEPVELDITTMGAYACLKPLKLDDEYVVELEARLAPPLLVSRALSLETPKPRLKIKAVRAAHTATGLLRLKHGNNVVELEPGTAALIVTIDEKWLDIVRGATIRVYDDDRLVASEIITDNPVIVPCGSCVNPRVELEMDSTRIYYGIDNVEDIRESILGSLRLVEPPVPTGLNSMSLKIEVETRDDIDYIEVDGKPARIVDRDKNGLQVECRLDDVYGENAELCACKRFSHKTLLLCDCKELSKLVHEALKHYADVHKLEAPEYLLIDRNKPILRLDYIARRGGIAYLVVSTEDERTITSTTVYLSSGKGSIAAKLPTDFPWHSVEKLVVQLSDARGVHTLERLTIFYRRPIAYAYRVGTQCIVCSESILVYKGDEGVEVTDGCIRVPCDDVESIIAVDNCGTPWRPSIEKHDITQDVINAVRTAAILYMLSR